MSFSQHLGAELVVYLASKESESLGIVFFFPVLRGLLKCTFWRLFAGC